MSLRAWLSLRTGKDAAGLKKRGDVLCVKLPDSPVGQREWNEFLIVDDWDDPELEKQLKTLRSAGEPHPVITHPYAVYDEPDEFGAQAMRVRSTVFVDVDGLRDKADVLDKGKPVAAKRSSELTIRRRQQGG